MPVNPRDQVMQRVDADQAALLRRENDLVREVAQAYEQARKDLLAEFTEAFANLGPSPTPAEIRQLATNAALIQAIERRLAQLEAEFGDILRAGLAGVSDEAFAAAAAEIGVFAEALGIELLQFSLDPLLELTIGPAIDQIPGLIASAKSTLLATMRESLAAGDRFSDIAQAVLGAQESAFRRGMTSAELMVRRATVQANNNAKLLFYEQARGQLPGLQKQAVAHVGGSTTRTCLHVHGQIRDLDEPFTLTAEPRFARKQMQPPFHWNCRTSVAPYLARFESTSTLTTPAMEAAAQAELDNRN